MVKQNVILHALILCFLVTARAGALDWPMFRADAARSGYTEDVLPEKLTPAWSYRSNHAPQSAWPSRRRLPFDRVYQPVVADGLVCFGSSADGKVYALDAVAGAPRWTFFTDAPVRFAPAIWQERVFVASDDGYVYCLTLTEGKLLWKLRGGPRPDRLLGNDRMISRWPVRGGPVVADGILYFAAGIWPSEKIFVYSVDPLMGKVLWCNNTSGDREMDQPHSNARARSGASAQGYLVAQGDALLVPTGRAVPAVFDRTDGQFRYFWLAKTGTAPRALGGSELTAIDNRFFNMGAVFGCEDGSWQASVGPLVAAHPGFVISAASSNIVAWRRDAFLCSKETYDRKGGKKISKVLGPAEWKATLPFDSARQLIVAGNTGVVGGNNRVVGLAVDSGKPRWTVEVEGAAHGLAVANGRLYVSTDRGTIHCFAGNPSLQNRIVQEKPWISKEDTNSLFVKAAEEIIQKTGVTEGYCLDLACGNGRLALELAKRTNLKIYAVDGERANVNNARRHLDQAGLYGMRVTVQQAVPAKVAYPNFFADLIVSGRSTLEGENVVPELAKRMQRPYGGIQCVGKPGAMKMSIRGPLRGAGNWTHQYSNPANTLCSEDERIRGPLAMLWFRDTDFFMPDRHGRGPAPLVSEGRMFMEGVNALRAVNVYNGRTLWELPIKGVLQAYHQEHLLGTAGTGSNFCVGGNQVYLRRDDRCLVIDAKSGKKVDEFKSPPQPDGKPGTWGYIAHENDTLFGSVANKKYVVKYCWRAPSDMSRLLTESLLFFALDAKTGKLKWSYKPQYSIRHNAIAIGKGRVYFIDRPLSKADDARFDPSRPTTRFSWQSNPEVKHPSGKLIALDAAKGKTLWRVEDGIFGTLLALSKQHGVLLMGYQTSNEFKLHSERGGRMAAFRSSTGERLWEVDASYKSRPILNDRTVYAEPGAWDLITGAQLPFELKRYHGCGILAGSRRLLVYRSATLGYFDLEGTRQTENYGGIRPGCWINAIPAGGLVVMDDAASWCTCSYLNQATIALEPAHDVGESAN